MGPAKFDTGAATGTPALMEYYEALSNSLGPMKWWPAQTRFEVIVGAILTQNTSWTNVEKAIEKLREAGMLTVPAMTEIPIADLESLIRPSGYFRQKAKTLKSFVEFLNRNYGGSLVKMFRAPTIELRAQVLAVRGIGPETADSILLYAGKHAVFVVDAYTHRILERHGVSSGKRDYDRVRGMFEASLPSDPALFNQYHALIVSTGKNWCHKGAPDCQECPLQSFLPAALIESTANPRSATQGKLQ